MSNQAKITQNQIQSRASSQSFSRGKNYYNNGSISQTVKRGNEIEARCRGSYAEPYRVSASLSESGIATTSCNCQYDLGGDCKHIVAMLLSYINHPEQFKERPPVQDSLMSREKKDLVELITLMVTRYPDLQNLVDRPTSTEMAEGKVTIDTLKIRQELSDSFSVYGYSYEYDDRNYRNTSHYNISEVTALAKRFSGQGDWHNASLMYRTILEEFADMPSDEYHDEEGELAMEIDGVVSHMEECLKQDAILKDDTERRAIFNALLGIFIWDIDFGGIDIGFDAPEIVLKYIRQEDIPEIRKMIEKERDYALNKSYGEWSAEAYTSFLVDLDTLDEVDPEIILENLRSQGMYHLLVSKLLEFKRPEEARKVFQEHFSGGYERIKALNSFIGNGYDEIAIEIMEQVLIEKFDFQLVTWLVDLYTRKGNQEKLLYWQQLMMKHQPSARLYQQLKEMALNLQQ